mmetsp:Transcript_4163/g.17578  ORF Transcript_4163/g.17578 Transcript_4163/m.17578 type:complete len:253 (-) Transcript_4163:1206-1964(-)
MDGVPADVGAAACSAFLVAPFVCIVDKSIISNASGRKPLWQSIKDSFKELLVRPHVFLRRPEFAWIFSLYGLTYLTANLTDSICEVKSVDKTIPKFLTTSSVNLTVCIAKDRAFTRMFGVVSPKPLPFATYALFAARDSLTVFTSFSVPPHAAKYVQDRHILSPERALPAVQIACPLAVQIISTPMHLLGLDLYNRPKQPVASRISFIAREYLKSTAARFARIGPAFGIGGVSNTFLRQKFQLMGKEVFHQA